MSVRCNQTVHVPGLIRKGDPRMSSLPSPIPDGRRKIGPSHGRRCRAVALLVALGLPLGGCIRRVRAMIRWRPIFGCSYVTALTI